MSMWEDNKRCQVCGGILEEIDEIDHYDPETDRVVLVEIVSECQSVSCHQYYRSYNYDWEYTKIN